MRRFFAVLLITGCCAGLAPVASAQTEQDARVMFQQGNARLQRAMQLRGAARARELREALSRYHRSLRITRARSVLFNIALCYEQLRRYGDAFTYYQEYLSLPDLDATDREAAQTALDGLRPRVALVDVRSTPPGATIYLDRRDLSPRGVTPSVVATTPGSHRVIVELPGFQPAEAVVRTALGRTRQAQLELQARPAEVTIITEPPGAEIRFDQAEGPAQGRTPATLSLPAGPHQVFVTLDERRGRRLFDAPPGGRMSVTVELQAPTTPGVVALAADVPGAQVSINGRPAGIAPLREIRLPPGLHRFTVTAGPHHRSWSDTVEIGPGHEVNLNVHLLTTEPQRRFGIWPNLGLVAATTLAVAGAALAGWTLALHRNFEEIKGTCTADSPQTSGWFQACRVGSVLRSEAETLDGRISNLALTTDLFLATAAAVGIVSVVLMLLNREIEDHSRVEVALAPIADGWVASLTARGMLRSSP